MKKSGKAKSIGVSNYTKRHLDATLKTAVERPALNQIEYHPYLQHKHVEGDLIAYHREKGIAVAAYGCLTPIIRAKDAGPLTTSDAALLEGLATKYAVNPSEILIRWCLDQDIVVITTTAKEQRMSDYLRALAFRLTPREVKEIAEVGERFHYRAFWNDKFVEGDRV